MKLLILYGIFSVIVLVSEAALSIYPADPNYPGSCYSDLTGKMEYDEVNTHLSGCARAICRNDGTIQVATCGVIASPCGTTPIDPSKPYPDCCPQPIRSC